MGNSTKNVITLEEWHDIYLQKYAPFSMKDSKSGNFSESHNAHVLGSTGEKRFPDNIRENNQQRFKGNPIHRNNKTQNVTFNRSSI